jgi:6-phosphogluconolactonase/glucosamine-6-phosphate isomerase/deaminase
VTRLRAFPDPQAAAEHAAQEIARALEEAREQRGVAHLALAGGSTPRAAYELLAGLLDDWSAVELWYGDERCVGPEDPESNHRLVADSLLARIPQSLSAHGQPGGRPGEEEEEEEEEAGGADDLAGGEGRARGAKGLAGGEGQARGAKGLADGEKQHRAGPFEHRILGELGPEAAARAYAAELRARVASAAQGAPPTLDLALLGIGEDGHTASLFPGSPAVEDSSGALCLPVRDAPKPPPERVTLSLPVLRAARRCLLLATGAGKAVALAAVLAGPDPRVPASLLASERLQIVADAAAAGDAASET